MKTILYATDCAPHSIQTLQYTAEISRRLNATLVVLHIFDIPTFSGISMLSPLRQTRKRAFEEKRNVLESYLKKNLVPYFDNLKIIPKVAKNISIIEEIILKTKELSPDLVVVGKKSPESYREIFESDISKTLIPKINCPLLIVPDYPDSRSIKNIVYATDFENKDVDAIKELSEIASIYEAVIHVVHISPIDIDEKAKMNLFKKEIQEVVKYPAIEFDLLSSDNTLEKINAYINSLDADMIAMMEREDKGIIKKLFHRDLVKKQESFTQVPILSFHE